MMDINKHRSYLYRILKDIYADLTLGNALGFKGGTALMFFYELPRFSSDLDFTLIQKEKEEWVYQKLKTILLKYGEIYDEELKFYGPLVVLNYGKGVRKLKVEVSNRNLVDHYKIKNLFGSDIQVMKPADMFAHKLCALLDRTAIANRDIFDCWFFMERQLPINPHIVEKRMKVSLSEHLENCIHRLENLVQRNRLQGLGEL